MNQKDNFTFNFRMVHNAAFLFYNLKGIVAEKWGHGYFNRYGDNINSIILENTDEKRNCNYGLKQTEIFLQNLDLESLNLEKEKVKELILDIINSISIVQTTLLEARVTIIHKLNNDENIFDLINDKFLKLPNDFFGIGSNYIDVGLNFNYKMNKYINSLSFGPFTQDDLSKFFKFKFELIENSIIMNFATKIVGKDLEIPIEKQKTIVEKIIDLNISSSMQQLDKIVEIMRS